jgi:hypothetical protein
MRIENQYRYVHVKFETKLQKYVSYTKITDSIVCNIRSRRILFKVTCKCINYFKLFEMFKIAKK